MSKYTEFYLNKVVELFTAIEAENKDAIDRASDILVEAIEGDKLIHVIGPGGHSNLGAEEMFYRAGGLVPVNPILDPGTALFCGAFRSTVIERTPGYGKAVLDSYGVGGDEPIIIINAYGINSMCIDVALEAKKRGMKTIGITSRSYADTVGKDHPARHPSGKNLYEIVDVFVDSHLPLGDAVVEFENFGERVAPTSTLVNSFTINLLVIETVRKLLEKGINPPIWRSANMPGGDEVNKKYFEKYMGRVKHLR